MVADNEITDDCREMTPINIHSGILILHVILAHHKFTRSLNYEDKYILQPNIPAECLHRLSSDQHLGLPQLSMIDHVGICHI